MEKIEKIKFIKRNKILYSKLPKKSTAFKRGFKYLNWETGMYVKNIPKMT